MLEGIWWGLTAALASAATWAIASHIYATSGKGIPAPILNLFKNVLALIVLSAVGILMAISPAGLTPVALIALFVSGILGMGVGDTAFLGCVARIGARRALVIETLNPVVSLLLAWIFLAETLNLGQIAGASATLAGVLMVLLERNHTKPNINSNIGEELPTLQEQSRLGILLGLVAVLSQSSGVVITRAVLDSSVISPLWSACVRLFAGALIAAGIVSFRPRFASVSRTTLRPWLWLAVACFFGTVLGLWFQQSSLKFAPAGLAGTLAALSPVFILPFAKLAGEHISRRAILGSLLALAGCAVIFAGL